MDVPATHGGLPALRFPDRAAWAAWLGDNADTTPAIWMILSKKGAARQTLGKADAIEVALTEGWIDGQADRLDAHHWLTRFTPRGPRSVWSQVNRAAAERLIAEGRMRPRGLAEVERARADGRWDAAYPSPADAQVPGDLQAALDASPAAAAAFAGIKRSARYTILHRVHLAKRADTRARRIETFVTMLATGAVIR